MPLVVGSEGHCGGVSLREEDNEQSKRMLNEDLYVKWAGRLLCKGGGD